MHRSLGTTWPLLESEQAGPLVEPSSRTAPQLQPTSGGPRIPLKSRCQRLALPAAAVATGQQESWYCCYCARLAGGVARCEDSRTGHLLPGIGLAALAEEAGRHRAASTAWRGM